MPRFWVTADNEDKTHFEHSISCWLEASTKEEAITRTKKHLEELNEFIFKPVDIDSIKVYPFETYIRNLKGVF